MFATAQPLDEKHTVLPAASSECAVPRLVLQAAAGVPPCRESESAKMIAPDRGMRVHFLCAWWPLKWYNKLAAVLIMFIGIPTEAAPVMLQAKYSQSEFYLMWLLEGVLLSRAFFFFSLLLPLRCSPSNMFARATSFFFFCNRIITHWQARCIFHIIVYLTS